MGTTPDGKDSIHIPNLAIDEVNDLFHRYINATGQVVEQGVIEHLYYNISTMRYEDSPG